MGRRILKISLIGFMLMGDASQVQATIMHDPTSFVKFAEIAKQGTQMIGQISKLQNEISTLNSVLGEPIKGSVMDHLGKGKWLMGDFGNVLDNLNSPYGDPLSSLNNLGRNQFGTPDQSSYLFLKDYAKSKLFNEQDYSALSFQKQDEIQAIRYDTVKKSAIESLALSGHQKSSLKQGHDKLQKLSQQALSDRTLQEEIRTTNQLLVVIANELSQQKAILAQLLELKAASTAQHMPVVFNKGSLSKRGGHSSSSSSGFKFGKSLSTKPYNSF